MCRKQEGIHQGCQAYFWTQGFEASSRDFRKVTGSEWLDIVEGLAPSKMAEEVSKAQPSEKNKDDDGAPGLTHTLLSNCSGWSVLRREQQKYLESDHWENQTTGKEGDAGHRHHKHSPWKRRNSSMTAKEP
jgi:hypothetical protein